MKDYREIADSVFRRSEEIIADKRRKRKTAVKAGTLAACFCFAALIGFGAWQSGAVSQDNGILSEDFTEENVHDGKREVMPDNGDSDPDGNYGDEYAEKTSDVVEISEQDPIASSEDTANYVILPDNGGTEPIEIITMISSYGEGDIWASYASPENGNFNFSIPLRGAIDEYGDKVLYRVFVDIFNNGEILEVNSPAVEEERQRLSDLGYTVALETYFDGENYNYYFTLHASMEQLTEFSASENYGYMLFLYDERVG